MILWPFALHQPVGSRWFFAGLLAWLIFAGSLPAGEIAAPYFGAKPGSLAEAKRRIAAGDPDLARALKKLLADADATLEATPPAVTEKTKVPPSGDRHDYMSLAPYFWPDPKSHDGRPYIRHDGKVNPESRDEQMNDGPRIRKMGDGIETLALAYYFTGREPYAAQAAKFARVWFLDPATRMNPTFQFAQAVLGQNDGRGTGILEARHIAIAADAIRLLSGSAAWTPADQTAMDQWCQQFLNWLLTSDAGKSEHAARNNHGTWFDMQTVELALSLGQTNLARTILTAARKNRIAAQIEPDGKQPLELVRTTSFSYSRFNLEAWCALATLGEYAGVDVWQFQTAEGRSLRRALDFLLPFINDPKKPWPYEQIKDKHDRANFAPILRQAALAYSQPAYTAAEAAVAEGQAKTYQLLFVK